MRSPLSPAARLWTSFPARLSVYLTVPLVVFGALLTYFSVRSQSALLEESLRNEGVTAAALLAEGLRIGVFTENRQILAEGLQSVVVRPNVMEAAVFSADGRMLVRVAGAGRGPTGDGIDGRDAARARTRCPAPLVVDGPDGVTFWSPVLTTGPSIETDDLYLSPAAARGADKVLGFAALRVSKRLLRKGRGEMVGRSLWTLGALLLVVAAVTALAVVEASRPLVRLLAQVRGSGLASDDGADDLGVLEKSFGRLVVALEDSIRRITELGEGLERTVAERTAELAGANEKLTEARDSLEERVRQRSLELDQTHRMLLHSEKLSALGRLSASFAHEINNPVFAVQGVLHALRLSGNLGPNELELVQAAADECGRVSRLAADLKSFHRPSSGEPSLVRLDGLLDAVLLLCRRELTARKVTLETHVAGDLPPVLAVPDQLKQVLLNLVGNALDAMAEGGGTLGVGCTANDTEVVIRVTDTGAGISEDLVGRIFEPFFTTKPYGKGTGLGLSISYQIVQAHGGSLDVESRPGKGTAFTVRLPLPPQALPPEEQPAAPA